MDHTADLGISSGEVRDLFLSQPDTSFRTSSITTYHNIQV